jgi:hypothetical protein
MRVYAPPKAENEMNAQGVNGKLMEDAQRSSSGRGIFGGVKWQARPVDKVGAISHLGSARPVCDFPSAGPDPPIPSLRTNLTLVLLVKARAWM